MKLRRMEKIKIPSMQEISRERSRLQYQNRYRAVLRSTIYSLVVVAAAAVLLATLFFPVLQVSGTSMEPTLSDRDILLLYCCCEHFLTCHFHLFHFGMHRNFSLLSEKQKETEEACQRMAEEAEQERKQKWDAFEKKCGAYMRQHQELATLLQSLEAYTGGNT